MSYESEMQALTASETTLLENIDTYKLDLANHETRKQNRDAEITALNEASTLLMETPAYQAAEAKAARAAQGECGTICAEKGDDHAECQACLEGVTVFGYCSQNDAAPGCAEATKTESAGALK